MGSLWDTKRQQAASKGDTKGQQAASSLRPKAARATDATDAESVGDADAATAAGAASLLAGEEWRRPNRYHSLHNLYYARSATTRQPFPGCAVLVRFVRTRVAQAACQAVVLVRGVEVP